MSDTIETVDGHLMNHYVARLTKRLHETLDSLVVAEAQIDRLQEINAGLVRQIEADRIETKNNPDSEVTLHFEEPKPEEV